MSYAGGASYELVLLPNLETGKLDCYDKGSFQVTYDVTITYNNNSSIDISAFNYSSAAVSFTVIIYY